MNILVLLFVLPAKVRDLAESEKRKTERKKYHINKFSVYKQNNTYCMIN